LGEVGTNCERLMRLVVREDKTVNILKNNEEPANHRKLVSSWNYKNKRNKHMLASIDKVASSLKGRVMKYGEGVITSPQGELEAKRRNPQSTHKGMYMGQLVLLVLIHGTLVEAFKTFAK
jgi:hypothetical protein